MDNQVKSKRFTVYDLVIVGVTAAIIFALTYLVRIEIPTPLGPTNLKLANAFILIFAMLFGGLRGGLAGGIGSMIFDLLNPAYVASAPFTLVFFFLMGFVCGIISGIGKTKGHQMLCNIIGGVAGSLTYFVLHIGKSLIESLLLGNAFIVALIDCSTKMITSGINAVIAVVISVLLVQVLSPVMARSGIFDKLGRVQ